MNKNIKLIIISSILMIGLVGATLVNKQLKQDKAENEQVKNNQDVKPDLSIDEISNIISKYESYKDLRKSKLEDIVSDISNEKNVSIFEDEFKDINKYIDDIIKLFEGRNLDQRSKELLDKFNLMKSSLENADKNFKLSLEEESKSKEYIEVGLKEVVKSYLYLNSIEESINSTNSISELKDEIKIIEETEFKDLDIPKEETKEDDKKENESEVKQEVVKEEVVKVENSQVEQNKEEVTSKPEVDYSYHNKLYSDVKNELLEYYPSLFLSDYNNGYLPEENFAPYYGEVGPLYWFTYDWGPELWRERECNIPNDKAKEEKFRLSMNKIHEAIKTVLMDLDDHGDGGSIDVEKLRSDLNECARIVQDNIAIIENIDF